MAGTFYSGRQHGIEASAMGQLVHDTEDDLTSKVVVPEYPRSVEELHQKHVEVARYHD